MRVFDQRFFCFLCAILFCTWSLAIYRAEGADGPENLLPWQGEVFEAQPQSILAAVKNLAPRESEGAEFLLWDERIQIDAEHRTRTVRRQVYVVQSRDEIEFRGTINALWSPWLEAKPEIRARVITLDGKVHPLDASTITESSAQNVGDQMFMDNRVISAPLPAVDVGSVVETEVIIQQHQPFCPQGVIGRMFWKKITNCREIYLEVRAAKSLNLRLFNVGEQVPLAIATEGDQKIWRLRLDSPERVKHLWAYLPSNVSNLSYVTFSTADSWRDIAGYYHAIVQEQIKDADLSDLVTSIKNHGGSRREQIQQACQQISKRTRFTGIEFGANAIRPHTPSETLVRHYGDCKDQASLLVAVLGRLDIAAHVALLNVQLNGDIVSDAPGMNAFDHAIVYVPPQADLAEFWVDLTATSTTFGELPISDQNRLALVAAPTTKDLKRTPSSSSGDNTRRQTYTYQLSTDQPSLAIIESESTGSFAADQRAFYAGQTRAQLLEAFQEQGAQQFGLTKINAFEYPDPEASNQTTYRVKYEFLATELASADNGQLVVELRPGAAFNYLPYEFVGPEYSTLDDGGPEREHPFVLPSKYFFETVYRLVPPTGFKIDVLPETHEFRVADFVGTMKCQETDGGTVEVVVSLDTGNGVLTSSQVEDFRDEFLSISMNKPPQNWVVPVTFQFQPRRTFDEGREPEAVRRMLELAEQNPQALFYRAELCSSLLSLGLGEEARQIADSMVRDEPESSRAHSQQAFVHMHDLLGNELVYGMNRRVVLEGFRRAIDLNENDLFSLYNYAVALEHDELGGRYKNEQDLREAAEIYKKLLQTHQLDLAMLNYGAVLMHLGDTRGLRRLSAQFPARLDALAFYATAQLQASGAKAAMRLVAQAAAQDRANLHTTVASAIRGLRRYDLLREYLQAVPETAGIAKSVQNIQTYEEVKLDPSQPASALQIMLARWLESGMDVDSIRQLYVNGENDEVFHAEIQQIPLFFQSVRDAVIQSYGRRDVAKDVVSLYEFSATGDDEGGYFVDGIPRHEPGAPRLRKYVVRDGDGYKLLAAGKAFSQFGHQALKLLDSGKPAAARRWIDEAYQVEKRFVGIFDPFAASPFAQAWFVAKAEDLKAIRMVALLLAAREESGERWLNELMASRKDATKLQQLQIDRACLRLLHLAGRNRESLDLANDLLNKYSNAAELIELQFYAQLQLGLIDEAEAALERLAGVNPNRAKFARRQLLYSKGGNAAVYEYLGKLAAAEDPHSFVLDGVSWRSLFVGKSGEVIEQAKQALQVSPQPAATLHTLACVYAFSGQLRPAIATMKETIRARNGLRDPIDDLILGRIAEHCGLPEAAQKYYRRVKASERDPVEAASSGALAELRLKLLPDEQPSD